MNHKRVRRLMREHGLQPRIRRRYVATTDSDHGGPIFSNRTKDVVLDSPNQLWVAVTGGFVYVAIILDAWSRRVVPTEWVAAALPETSHPAPSAAEVWSALQVPSGMVQLAEGLALRRVTVMQAARIELIGFGEGQVARFKALGLFAEIIAWKLRLFVPVGDGAAGVFTWLVTRYPVTRLGARAAA